MKEGDGKSPLFDDIPSLKDFPQFSNASIPFNSSSSPSPPSNQKSSSKLITKKIDLEKRKAINENDKFPLIEEIIYDVDRNFDKEMYKFGRYPKTCDYLYRRMSNKILGTDYIIIKDLNDNIVELSLFSINEMEKEKWEMKHLQSFSSIIHKNQLKIKALEREKEKENSIKRYFESFPAHKEIIRIKEPVIKIIQSFDFVPLDILIEQETIFTNKHDKLSRLNKEISSSSQDPQLWMKMLKIQDETFSENSYPKLVLLEKKIKILERGLEACPGNSILIFKLMELANEAHDHQTVLEMWKKFLESTHSSPSSTFEKCKMENNVNLQIGYINYLKSYFLSFEFNQVIFELFDIFQNFPTFSILEEILKLYWYSGRTEFVLLVLQILLKSDNDDNDEFKSLQEMGEFEPIYHVNIPPVDSSISFYKKFSWIEFEMERERRFWQPLPLSKSFKEQAKKDQDYNFSHDHHIMDDEPIEDPERNIDTDSLNFLNIKFPFDSIQLLEFFLELFGFNMRDKFNSSPMSFMKDYKFLFFSNLSNIDQLLQMALLGFNVYSLLREKFESLNEMHQKYIYGFLRESLKKFNSNSSIFLMFSIFSCPSLDLDLKNLLQSRSDCLDYWYGYFVYLVLKGSCSLAIEQMIMFLVSSSSNNILTDCIEIKILDLLLYSCILSNQPQLIERLLYAKERQIEYQEMIPFLFNNDNQTSSMIESFLLKHRIKLSKKIEMIDIQRDSIDKYEMVKYIFLLHDSPDHWNSFLFKILESLCMQITNGYLDGSYGDFLASLIYKYFPLINENQRKKEKLIMKLFEWNPKSLIICLALIKTLWPKPILPFGLTGNANIDTILMSNENTIPHLLFILYNQKEFHFSDYSMIYKIILEHFPKNHSFWLDYLHHLPSRDQLFKAIQQCPWCKDLYLLAIERKMISAEELVPLMEEKGLRIRTLLEELPLYNNVS